MDFDLLFIVVVHLQSTCLLLSQYNQLHIMYNLQKHMRGEQRNCNCSLIGIDCCEFPFHRILHHFVRCAISIGYLFIHELDSNVSMDRKRKAFTRGMLTNCVTINCIQRIFSAILGSISSVNGLTII